MNPRFEIDQYRLVQEMTRALVQIANELPKITSKLERIAGHLEFMNNMDKPTT